MAQGAENRTKQQRPASFIEALAAVPDAAQALAKSRTALAGVRARQSVAVTAVANANARLAAATDAVHEAGLARAFADRASAAAQDAMDDAARTMYTTGGSVPRLAEVMLTSDSEEGFLNSLLTREYLASASDEAVRIAEVAATQRVQAQAMNALAVNQREAARSSMISAQAVLRAISAQATAAQKVVDGARREYQSLMRITKVDRSGDYGRIRKCGDWLTRLLSKTGFKDEDLREAWAVVMRESGGREDAVSQTQDLGLFQINTATWQDQEWFDRELLLERRYNAAIAFDLSQGGRSWYSWGLDGHGRPDAGAYVNAGWSAERIQSHIVMPYVQWYARYPCRPAYEKDAPDLLPPPPPPNSDEVTDPLDPFIGDGQLAGRPEAA